MTLRTDIVSVPGWDAKKRSDGDVVLLSPDRDAKITISEATFQNKGDGYLIDLGVSRNSYEPKSHKTQVAVENVSALERAVEKLVERES